VAGSRDQVRQEARGFPYCWRRGVKSKWGQKGPQSEKVRQEIAVSSAAAKQWLAEREADLLPAPYYHMVFTLRAAVSDIALDLLFKALAEATPASCTKRFGVLDDGAGRRRKEAEVSAAGHAVRDFFGIGAEPGHQEHSRPRTRTPPW
jgi:hypothetical protein